MIPAIGVSYTNPTGSSNNTNKVQFGWLDSLLVASVIPIGDTLGAYNERKKYEKEKEELWEQYQTQINQYQTILTKANAVTSTPSSTSQALSNNGPPGVSNIGNPTTLSPQNVKPVHFSSLQALQTSLGIIGLMFGAIMGAMDERKKNDKDREELRQQYQTQINQYQTLLRKNNIMISSPSQPLSYNNTASAPNLKFQGLRKQILHRIQHPFGQSKEVKELGIFSETVKKNPSTPSQKRIPQWKRTLDSQHNCCVQSQHPGKPTISGFRD